MKVIIVIMIIIMDNLIKRSQGADLTSRNSIPYFTNNSDCEYCGPTLIIPLIFKIRSERKKKEQQDLQ